jgi:hypothetical protein
MGYAHYYSGMSGSRQQLLGGCDLIILCQLAAARIEYGFVPNHVRRLCAHGITNAVVVEAATPMAAVTGWNHGGPCRCGHPAGNEPDYPYDK